MYFSAEQVQRFMNIIVDSFEHFDAYFDLIWKGLVGKEKVHDTLKKTDASFKFGVKDGSELVVLCPKIRQTGLINFTDELRNILPGAKKLLTPILYLANNRMRLYSR